MDKWKVVLFFVSLLPTYYSKTVPLKHRFVKVNIFMQHLPKWAADLNKYTEVKKPWELWGVTIFRVNFVLKTCPIVFSQKCKMRDVGHIEKERRSFWSDSDSFCKTKKMGKYGVVWNKKNLVKEGCFPNHSRHHRILYIAWAWPPFICGVSNESVSFLLYVCVCNFHLRGRTVFLLCWCFVCLYSFSSRFW